MTPSSTAAAVGSYHFILVLFLLGFASDKVDAGPLKTAMEHISVGPLLDDLSRGLVDSRRLVFWISTAVVPLIATVKTVEAWRWG
jgi:ABC-2 type transport system permease protein